MVGKLWRLVLIAFLIGSQTAFAAESTTPNLGLVKPSAAPGTWAEDINDNFDKIDSAMPGGQGGHTIQEEGSTLPVRGKLNFIGSGITATDNGATGATDVTVSITGAGHTVKDEGSALTAQPNLNFTGAGVTCTNDAGNSATKCDIPAGSTDATAAYAWTGANSWKSNNWSLFDSSDTSKILKWNISGFTTATTRTMTLPNASTRILGDSDFSTTGIMTRTGSGTFAARSLTGASGNISITSNADGVAGNPVIDLGATAVQTDQSNTITTGDQSYAAASSLTVPIAAGATPTANGRIAYNSSTNRFVGGVNGATIVLAPLAEVQALNSNLTALSSLTGSNHGIPMFTGAGAMSQLVIPDCGDTGGQHLNFNGTIVCGTSGGSGLSGMTAGKLQKSLTATTVGDSLVSESGSAVTVAGDLKVGDTSTNDMKFDPSAVTGHRVATLQDQDGTLLLGNAAGTFTDGHVVTAAVVGGVVTLSDGGAAGSGTVTATSTDTLTNKTINAESTGNVITTVAKIYLPAAGGTVAAPGLLWDALASNAPTAVCSAGSTETTLLRCTADFPDADGDYSLQQAFMLPSDWTGNIDLKFMWKAAATSGDAVWQAALVCRADGEADDAAFNTANTVTDTAKGTTLQLNTASIASMTTTGCAAGELAHLKVFRNRTHASDTITGTISLVGVEVTARRAQ